MYPAMMSAECVSAGDMDGDGDLDLVVGNLNAGSVSVFLNRGDGTFAPQVTYKDFQPQSLALADLDGDGRLDVVVSNGNGGSVSVCRNVGGGKLDGRAVYPVGGYPNAIVVADFDGDGHLDIADADNTSASVSILRNLGDGTFAPRIAFDFGSRPEVIAAGDVDGDGHPDLVATSWGYLMQTYAPPMVGVLHNKGDGSFVLGETYTPGDSPAGVALADLDGDGWLDLVVGDSWSKLRVYLNRGDGTFGDATEQRERPAHAAAHLEGGGRAVTAAILRVDRQQRHTAARRHPRPTKLERAGAEEAVGLQLEERGVQVGEPRRREEWRGRGGGGDGARQPAGEPGPDVAVCAIEDVRQYIGLEAEPDWGPLALGGRGPSRWSGRARRLGGTSHRRRQKSHRGQSEEAGGPTRIPGT